MSNWGTIGNMNNKPRFALSFFNESKAIKRNQAMSELTWTRIKARMKQIMDRPLEPEELAWLDKPIQRLYPERPDRYTHEVK